MGINLSVFFMLISAAISILLPICLAVYLNRKFKTSWKAVIVGAAIFILFQPLTRLQLLKFWQGTSWYTYNSVVNPRIIYLIAGFSAAIFENVGRFIGFKFLLKNKLQWKNGIAYGIGHGGIEAILFAGIPFISAIIVSFSNPALINQAPVIYLVGGLERLFAMTFHVAASLIVLYGVRNKKYIYLLYAILLHGIMDSSIGFIKNVAIIEAFVAVLAFVSLFFIIKLIKKSSKEKILD